jgi:hypothetical protein
MIESISVNQNKINEHSITQGYTKERLGEMAQVSFTGAEAQGGLGVAVVPPTSLNFFI